MTTYVANSCTFKADIEIEKLSTQFQSCLLRVVRHLMQTTEASVAQAVILIDAKSVNIALSSKEGLNKGIEPDGADEMLSAGGHRTLFSADTNSKYWRLVRKGTTAAFQHKNIR